MIHIIKNKMGNSTSSNAINSMIGMSIDIVNQYAATYETNTDRCQGVVISNINQNQNAVISK